MHPAGGVALPPVWPADRVSHTGGTGSFFRHRSSESRTLRASLRAGRALVLTDGRDWAATAGGIVPATKHAVHAHVSRRVNGRQWAHESIDGKPDGCNAARRLGLARSRAIVDRRRTRYQPPQASPATP